MGRFSAVAICHLWKTSSWETTRPTCSWHTTWDVHVLQKLRLLLLFFPRNKLICKLVQGVVGSVKDSCSNHKSVAKLQWLGLIGGYYYRVSRWLDLNVHWYLVPVLVSPSTVFLWTQFIFLSPVVHDHFLLRPVLIDRTIVERPSTGLNLKHSHPCKTTVFVQQRNLNSSPV